MSGWFTTADLATKEELIELIQSCLETLEEATDLLSSDDMQEVLSQEEYPVISSANTKIMEAKNELCALVDKNKIAKVNPSEIKEEIVEEEKE